MKRTLFTALSLFALAFSAIAVELGEVTTAWKLIGANHKIVIEAFDDPMVAGVTCYISRAKTGGVTGSLGLAEDTSDASVACRQVGDISFPAPIPKKDVVFKESASILFKKVQVVRLVDSTKNVLVYMVYADKLIDGSPKNSITAVPVNRETKIPVR